MTPGDLRLMRIYDSAILNLLVVLLSAGRGRPRRMTFEFLLLILYAKFLDKEQLGLRNSRFYQQASTCVGIKMRSRRSLEKKIRIHIPILNRYYQQYITRGFRSKRFGNWVFLQVVKRK
jgi:hypothetical protein